MEITWYGHSCFRLVERGMASVVCDPYDHNVVGYSPLKLRADIVTVSHQAEGHNYVKAVRSGYRLIDSPGEYEIGGVFITAVPTSAGSRREKPAARNMLYVFDYDGVTIAHLGDLQREPSQTEIEALGSVSVALVPVGGGKSLNAAKAAEVVSLIEPGIVIPMHYHTPDNKIKLTAVNKFLKEMGVGSLQPEPSLKISRVSVPNETKVVLLSYEH